MNIFVSILSGAVAGLIIGYFIWGRKDSSPTAQNDDDGDLIYQKEAEKAANLEKLKSFIAGKDKITNDEVQALLNVSDATAERYLDEIEHQGLIKQVGKTGIKTYYEKP